MITLQHKAARRLLPIIIAATQTNKLLTYGMAAKELGRDPTKNSRMVAQVCDLLDAAAAHAGIPLLALVAVREASGDINRKAWANRKDRKQIIANSLAYQFGQSDFLSISKALDSFGTKGNKAAWDFVYSKISRDALCRRLAGGAGLQKSDAIDDIGADTPPVTYSYTKSYARDPKVRAAVKDRAAGKCEFCEEATFLGSDGIPYLEAHHIIALADDGADRMTNVLALCPSDHREVHFGARREAMEKEMVRKVILLEQRRLSVRVRK